MILSKMTVIQHEVYVATYGAYFAVQVRDRMKGCVTLGWEPPDVDDYDRFAQEADRVACEAADRVPTP